MRLALAAALTLCLAACDSNLTPVSPDETATPPSGDSSLPGRDPYQPPSAQSLGCVPNLDGKIDSTEVKIGLGASLAYLVPPAGQMHDLEGVTAIAPASPANLSVVWDWGTDYAEDQVARVGPTALTGKWYAASFPKGQFTVPVDLGDTVEAINSIDGTGMYLHGIASKEQNPAEGQTLCVYNPPIKALLFPIMPGADWTSTGVITNGMYKGLPFASQDTYHVRVDAMGSLTLPDVTFKQVHRVRTDVTVDPAVGIKTTQKQVSFYFECFGEVARATSKTGETSDDFTDALEIRRLGL